MVKITKLKVWSLFTLRHRKLNKVEIRVGNSTLTAKHLICNLPNRRAAKNFILDLKLFERLAKWVDWYRTHVKFELLYLNPSRNEWTTWRSWMFLFLLGNSSAWYRIILSDQLDQYYLSSKNILPLQQMNLFNHSHYFQTVLQASNKTWNRTKNGKLRKQATHSLMKQAKIAGPTLSTCQWVSCDLQ